MCYLLDTNIVSDLVRNPQKTVTLRSPDRPVAHLFLENH